MNNNSKVTVKQLTDAVTGLKKYSDKNKIPAEEAVDGAIYTSISSYPYRDLIVSDSLMYASASTDSTLTIRLKDKPLQNQTVSLTSNNSIMTISPNTLTFTPDNYSTAQTVAIDFPTITSDNDGDQFILSIESGTFYKDVTFIYASEGHSSNIISYNLSNNPVNNIITNDGTGGDKYNATINTSAGGTAEVTDKGLTLSGQAYVEIPWTADAKAGSWTVELVVSEIVYNDTSYGRVFRSSSDTPSMYLSKTLGWRTKIGATKALTNDSNAAMDPQYIVGKTIVLKYNNVNNTCYLKVGNDDTISATMNVTNTGFYLGNNDPSKAYYFDKITFSEFRVYNYLKQ